MKNLISLALALVLALSCLSVTAFAEPAPDATQMISYHQSPCSLTLPNLPQYIKGTFDYDETKAAILTEHPDYGGIGMIFATTNSPLADLYDLSYRTDGTVTTYEYTLKEDKTVADYQQAMGIENDDDIIYRFVTIDVALRMTPLAAQVPAAVVRHEILEVTDIDGNALYHNGIRTGEGYGYQSGFLPPLLYDGDYTEIPTVVYAHEFTDGVMLWWTRCEGVARYAVYQRGKDGWTRVGESEGNSFTDLSGDQNGIYTYTVRGLSEDGTQFVTDFDRVGYTYRKEDSSGADDDTELNEAPRITSLTDTADGVNIQWDPIRGAYKYRVYYKSGNGWTRMAETDRTHFLDRDVKWGASYTYTVRCINEAGRLNSPFNADGWKHTHYLDTPQITALSSTGNGVRITWSKIDGAAQYRVYYKGRNGWTKMAQTADTSYVDTDVSIGATYTYTVRCLNAAGDTFVSSFNSNGWKYTYYPQNTPRITSFESTASGVVIHWDKVDGAEKYAVYYMGRNGWTRMGTTASTSYLDKDVKVGSTYRYTVRCINSALTKFTSDCDSGGWTYTFSPALDTPHIKSYENLADCVRITWDPVKGAARYRLYYQIVDFNTGWKRGGETTTNSIDFKISDYERETDLPVIYTVRCITADGKGFCSDFDRDNEPHTFFEPPHVSTQTTRDGVKITWSRANDATYRVYYKGRNGWTRMADVKGGEYIDSDVKAMSTYTYTVRRISDDGTKFLSYFNTSGVRHVYDTSKLIPEIKHIIVYEDGLYFYTGAPIAGVTKYRLFVRENNSWQRFAVADIDYDTYYDYENADEFYMTENFTHGKTYTFTLRGMDSQGNYVTDFYSDGFTIAALDIAYFNDISYDPATKKLTVAWEPVDGAKGYMVHFIPDSTQEIHEPMYIEGADSCTVHTVGYADVPWIVYFGAYNDDNVFGTVIQYNICPRDYAD